MESLNPSEIKTKGKDKPVGYDSEKEFRDNLEIIRLVERLDVGVFVNIVRATESYLNDLKTKNDVPAIDAEEVEEIDKKAKEDFGNRSESTGEYSEDRHIALARTPSKSDAKAYIGNLEELQRAAREENKRKVIVCLSILAGQESNFDNPHYHFSKIIGIKRLIADEFGYFASVLTRSSVPLPIHQISSLQNKAWVLGRPVSAADPGRDEADYGEEINVNW